MKYINLLLAIPLLFSVSYAELAPSAFSFSALLYNSELVVEGTVISVDRSQDQYKISFSIDECLAGPCDEEVLDIFVPLARGGLYHEDEAYLGPNDRRIVFLHSKGGLWAITNGIAGVLNPSMREEVRALYQRYRSNPQIFTQAYSAELIDVFNLFRNKDVRTRLLYDLENSLSTKDDRFISGLIGSDDKTFVIFGLLQAGRNRIESLKHEVESTLNSSKDSEIIFHSIVALGNYGLPESLPLVLSYLHNPEQGIRRAVIEAAGKTRTESILAPLNSLFPNETDWGNRLAIIDAIYPLSSRELVLNALNEFKTVESNDFVLSILEKRIESLSGN